MSAVCSTQFGQRARTQTMVAPWLLTGPRDASHLVMPRLGWRHAPCAPSVIVVTLV